MYSFLISVLTMRSMFFNNVQWKTRFNTTMRKGAWAVPAEKRVQFPLGKKPRWGWHGGQVGVCVWEGKKNLRPIQSQLFTADTSSSKPSLTLTPSSLSPNSSFFKVTKYRVVVFSKAQVTRLITLCRSFLDVTDHLFSCGPECWKCRTQQHM